MGSRSLTKDETWASCIGSSEFNHWTTREVLSQFRLLLCWLWPLAPLPWCHHLCSPDHPFLVEPGSHLPKTPSKASPGIWLGWLTQKLIRSSSVLASSPSHDLLPLFSTHCTVTGSSKTWRFSNIFFFLLGNKIDNINNVCLRDILEVALDEVGVRRFPLSLWILGFCRALMLSVFSFNGYRTNGLRGAVPRQAEKWQSWG